MMNFGDEVQTMSSNDEFKMMNSGDAKDAGEREKNNRLETHSFTVNHFWG